MKRLIWLPIAGFLLIAGAAVAAATPGMARTAAALVGAQNSDAEIAEVAFRFDDAGSLLEEVLADLVTSGTITQEQSDAIVEALTTRAEERRAELEQQREQMQAMWKQIHSFLEDGVISADEIAQLPDDNPITALESILEDGQITLEELQSVGPFGGFGGPVGPAGPGARGHGHGFHVPGPGMWFAPPGTDDSGSDKAPNATPEATS